MDPAIIAAIIGGCAVIIGAIITVTLTKKNPEKKQNQDVTGNENTIIQASDSASVKVEHVKKKL